MALLTAEDVLNKAFSKTKYREGFDQDEVDDFLDEVANSIAALTAERDELQQRLAQAQAGGAVVPAAAPAPAPTPAPAAATAPSGSESFLQAATDPNPPSATTMLAMAQKLHDEYVQAGEEARDRLIDEGKVKAETIVERAESDARARMQDLETERADLERRIDDLRRFERDYRGHLRNYLENLLGDLEHNAAKASAGPVGSSASDPDAQQASTPQQDAPGEPGAPLAFGEGFGVPGTEPRSDAAPSADAAPLARQRSAAASPESGAAFGDQQQPQGEQNPFGSTEPWTPQQAPVSPAQGNESPAPPSKDDESGENPNDAPRWNS
ncbi:DivIVA domain-containing protein [Demequina sp.]|uniref:DivIVA domain-containing protein n=1 Tax=Demequina sp. TaxID=2050685 RepID=UPI0025C417CC|nr:DivIVA domain-containing protein [Demequina sp.]